jgi:acetate kinase
MMGTRSGSIDPGVPLHLLREGRLTVEGLADALEHRSGLLGVSGRSADMRAVLVARASGDERAALAVDMFVRRVAAGIAGAATSLARLDALAFTGGVGEHAGEIRREVAARLAPLGVASPADGADSDGDGMLSQPGYSPVVLRVEAREDLVIASEVAQLAATMGTSRQRP